MQYKDKYNLTRDQNVRFAKMNFTRLVHTNARFEGINTTLPQTQTIMDGMGVDVVSVEGYKYHYKFETRMGVDNNPQ